MRTAACVFGVLLAGSAGAVRAQPDPQLVGELTAEAPRAWRELPAALGCYRVEVDLVERRKNTGSGETIRRAKYASACSTGGRTLSTVEEDRAGQYGASAVAVNDRYAFVLSRRRAGGPWLLDRIDLNPRPGPDAELGGFPLRRAWRSVFPWLTVNPNLELIDLVTGPTFKVVGTSRPSAGEIRFEFTATNLVKKVIEEKYSGWLQFDRSRHWALTAYDMSVTTPGDAGGRAAIAFTCQYTDHPKGLPVPVKMVTVHKGYQPADKLINEMRTEYDIRYDDRACPDEAEFELPAFGLPEPVGVRPPRTPLYWWFIGAGVAAALAGSFILRRIARK